jgi:ribonuclease Z
MEKMEVTFLGTGNAVPTEKRNHTGILVSFRDENILVDCGEGIQRQFKIAGISPAKLSRILITHWHGDHILGLPGLIQTLAMSGYSRTLKVYGPKGTQYFMQLIRSLVGNFHINLEVHEVSGIFVNDKDFYIEAGEMMHDTPCNAYSIVLKDKIRLDKAKIDRLKLPNSPLLGHLQEGKDIIVNGKKIKAKSVTFLEQGKKISFILDTLLNKKAIDLVKNSDFLITEATFSNEEAKKAREYHHLTAGDAAMIAKKSKSKKLIITHISQRYEHRPEIIEKEAKKVFKNTMLVKDFDVVEI